MKNINYDPKILPRSSLTHTQTILSFCKQLLLLLKTVKTWHYRKHALGRARLTVMGQFYSFSSQWLVSATLFAKQTNIEAQHVLDLLLPLSSMTHSDQCYIITSIFTTVPSPSYIFRWWLAHLLWWYHIILPDEVKRTQLLAEGGILPPAGGGQDCYIYWL